MVLVMVSHIIGAMTINQIVALYFPWVNFELHIGIKYIYVMPRLHGIYHISYLSGFKIINHSAVMETHYWAEK